MDKKSIIGFVLIAVIMIGFTMYNSNLEQETKAEKARQEQLIKASDSLSYAKEEAQKKLVEKAIDSVSNITNDSTQLQLPAVAYADRTKDSIRAILEEEKRREQYGVFFDAVEGEEKEIVLENERIKLAFSSKGARVTSAEIKGYESYNGYIDGSGEKVKMFDKDSSHFSLFLNPSKGRHTGEFYFDVIESSANKVVFRLSGKGKEEYIDFIYSLPADSYTAEFKIAIKGLGDELRKDDLSLSWAFKGLINEKLAENERLTSTVMFKPFEDGRDYLSEASEDDVVTEEKVEWVAFKEKFFSSILFLDGGNGFQSGSKLSILPLTASEKYSKYYSADLKLPIENTEFSELNFRWYFGPHEYEELLVLGGEAGSILNYGWGIFGTMNEWLIRPLFVMLIGTGWHIGIIILLLTIAIRLLIMPLTYKNYLSSAKMRVLKPEMEKINEKHKGSDETMKRQQATQALYKKTGVNPLAGCLPMLIQTPILFAMFRLFPASIELRHESLFWAEDLSSFDAIYTWTEQIPLVSSFYGNHISLLTILMALSTLAYTHMNSSNMQTPQQPGMPNMKVIMYIFPIMMIFIFNKFAAGLSLYYLIGNLASMGIMLVIKKYFIDENKIMEKIEENKKKPVKESSFQKRIKDMQKQQMQSKKKK